MTFNNSSTKSIRAKEKDAALAETNRIAYTRKIMSDAFGRAWMHTHLLECKVFHTPFVAGDQALTAFNCGSQNIGLRLFGDIASACPAEYTLMMNEASTKDLAHERRDSEPTSDTGTGTPEGFNRDPSEPASAYGLDENGFVSYGPEGRA